MESFDPLNPPGDPYLALGVSKSDNLATIKSAYRKLALKYHPDKSDESVRDKNIAEFHKIQQAYDILNDDDRRKEYDDLKKLLDLRDRLRKEATKPNNFTSRPPPRSRTFHSEINVHYEDRRPRYQDDDEIPRGTARKNEFETRRSRATDRVRTDRADIQAEERRKKDKIRDQDIRSSRSTKYEYDYSERFSPRDRDYDERDRVRRMAENRTDKYDDWIKDAQKHQSFNDDSPRASIRREGSSYAYVRPSRTSTKDRDRERDRDRDRERLAELIKEKERLERATRRNVRPGFQDDFSIPRRGSDPITPTTSTTSPISPPKFSRSESMPIPTSNTANSSRRREPTRLRETTLADGYDSSSSSSDGRSPRRYTAKPVKTSVRYETREPRPRSPERASTRRASYDYPPQTFPIRTRSPERMRNSDYNNPLSDRKPAPYSYRSMYSEKDVNYQSRFTKDDIKYASIPRSGERTPLGRANTMPVSGYA